MRDARQLALIGVGQVLDEFRDGDPRDLGDLWILIVHNAVYKTQQVVVHGLMDCLLYTSDAADDVYQV